MMNFSYAVVSPTGEEGVISLSQAFQKESALTKVDIIQDWMADFGKLMTKAAEDMADPDFGMEESRPSKFTAIKLCANLEDDSGTVVMPRWFGKAAPRVRLAFLRDWERALSRIHQKTKDDWDAEHHAYVAAFRKKRIIENRVK